MGFNSAFKGLNAKLNPICRLLILLESHHVLHISKMRVKHESHKWEIRQGAFALLTQ